MTYSICEKCSGLNILYGFHDIHRACKDIEIVFTNKSIKYLT